MNKSELNEMLKWSSRYGYTEIVKLLLENGADVHADNDYALEWSSSNGHTEVVKLLKSHINKNLTK